MPTDNLGLSMYAPEGNLQGPAVSAKPRHIILAFDLKRNPKEFGKSGNSQILNRLFPETHSVWFDGYFLLFYLRYLPPVPRPQTVAGVPAYFTTDLNDDGPSPPVKRTSLSYTKIRPEVNYRDDVNKIGDAFELVKTFFTEKMIKLRRYSIGEIS